MDRILKIDTVDGNQIGCEFLFYGYDGNKYQSDFKNWIDYQVNRPKGENPEDASYKYLNLNKKAYVNISYEQFKEQVASLFQMCLVQMIKNDPELIKYKSKDDDKDQSPKKLIIEILLRSVIDSEDYFTYIEEASNPEVACFKGPGQWFLQHLVAPWIYEKRIDYKNIERFFAGRIRIHYGYQNKEFSFENKYAKNFRGLPGIAHTYNLKYLYASAFYLKEDGLTDFKVKNRDSGVFEIRQDAIGAYNAHMNRLAELTSKNAKSYYESYIGEGNVTPDSETSIGRVMCTVIAMHISKTQGRAYTVVVKSQELKSTDITNFDSLFNSQYAQQILIKNLNPKVISETISTLQKLDEPILFLKIYEEACKNLGISDKNMAMTPLRFYTLVRKAVANGEAYYAKKMVDKGFDGSVMEK